MCCVCVSVCTCMCTNSITIMMSETFSGKIWINVYSRQTQNQWQIKVNVPRNYHLKSQSMNWACLKGCSFRQGRGQLKCRYIMKIITPGWVTTHETWSSPVLKLLQNVQADQHAGEAPPWSLADWKDFLKLTYCLYYLREGSCNLFSAFAD